jgi:catechol-2,3-dioxygenase
VERDYPIGGAEDHGATISVYLSDPDGNGIELYYDRPREEWGSPKAEPFDPRELLVESGPTTESLFTEARRRGVLRSSVEEKGSKL